jgi:hypothetical protein
MYTFSPFLASIQCLQQAVFSVVITMSHLGMSALPLRFLTPFPKRFSRRCGTPREKLSRQVFVVSILTRIPMISTCSDSPPGRKSGCPLKTLREG